MKIILICFIGLFPVISLFAQHHSVAYQEAFRLNKEAFRLHQTDKYAKSTKLAKQALNEETADSSKANLFYLLFENKTQDFFRLDNRQVLNYLDSTIYYAPNHPKAHHHLGALQLYSDSTTALKHLKKALALTPNATATIYELCNHYSETGDFMNTIKYATLGLKHCNQATHEAVKINFYIQKAEALYYNEESAAALVAFDSVIALDTFERLYDARVWYTRSLCYNDLDQYDNALRDLEALLAISKERQVKKDPFITYHLAIAYQNSSNPNLEKALYYINLSTKETLKYPDLTVEDLDFCYATRGAIFLDLNRPSKALKDFLKLEEDEDRNYWIGLAYLKLKNYQEALLFLQKYLEYNPDNVDAFLAISNVYYGLNDLPQACYYINELLPFYSEQSLEDQEALTNALLLKQQYCK